ncbi:uncharacterized protein LACBIDRAFT_300414 [Laccaria bicolor S238N-H82]|uniref:Predicted protein n=1 Tax=Laccaria bicolor (strain S238N-H82 / ATCC MYA-4686) TaxID=486041 RepID=B0DGQ1_LACBS|nr:uncharacterized protein LACBIDRAFT_300414 [Laccaria bicolor S238N-H82]EDR06191.1 predicted protein [Laccaria bicolor S238N-H82]|eukprot:XP_001883052.1 predicted protein [Laccaria bicolor S238N-H82]
MRQTSPAMPSRAPEPSHRHGSPSGPWPFFDIDDELDADQSEDTESHWSMTSSPCHHVRGIEDDKCWCKYPQSLFRNWTPRRQKKSKISEVVEKSTGLCTIHYADVLQDGEFVHAGAHEVQESNVDEYWGFISQGRPTGVRCRALFIDHLSGPVLQMLGAKYIIEPFYFSSSLGWIPSRYQSNKAPRGDHITITLTFARTMRNPTTVPLVPNSSIRSASTADTLAHGPPIAIDTQLPLPLQSNGILVYDLLALHMVRSEESNTIISYHPGNNHLATTAEALHHRFKLIGRSVYWSSIFKETNDPTLFLLSLMWYPVYCWDEVFETLYYHICDLVSLAILHSRSQLIGLQESTVLTTNDTNLTHKLHAIRAHLLHYQALLDDFRKTITFIKQTPFPALNDSDGYPPRSSEISQQLLETESANLLREIQRLEDTKELQERRLKNVMNLTFSIVNIDDSRDTRKLTEASVRDSAAMKQIAYLTMFFLPATFVAGIFGMNIREINPGTKGTLLHFFVAVIPLTLITIWLIVAYQIQATIPRLKFKRSEDEGAEAEDLEGRYMLYDGTTRLKTLSWWTRLSWPVVLVSSLFEKKIWKKRRQNLGNWCGISGC